METYAMKCPIDGNELVMSERQGVEIDYCPKCRGVWLDRGELDKIIERSGESGGPAPRDFRDMVSAPKAKREYLDDEIDDTDEVRYRDDRGRSDDYDRSRPRKRKSFLSEIFDVFD
jgi:Zn-finger nucleic acid-binding protein